MTTTRSAPAGGRHRTRREANAAAAAAGRRRGGPTWNGPAEENGEDEGGSIVGEGRRSRPVAAAGWGNWPLRPARRSKTVRRGTTRTEKEEK